MFLSLIPEVNPMRTNIALAGFLVLVAACDESGSLTVVGGFIDDDQVEPSLDDTDDPAPTDTPVETDLPVETDTPVETDAPVAPSLSVEMPVDVLYLGWAEPIYDSASRGFTVKNTGDEDLEVQVNWEGPVVLLPFFYASEKEFVLSPGEERLIAVNWKGRLWDEGEVVGESPKAVLVRDEGDVDETAAPPHLNMSLAVTASDGSSVRVESIGCRGSTEECPEELWSPEGIDTGI